LVKWSHLYINGTKHETWTEKKDAFSHSYLEVEAGLLVALRRAHALCTKNNKKRDNRSVNFLCVSVLLGPSLS
jgi:hypothetical protein